MSARDGGGEVLTVLIGAAGAGKSAAAAEGQTIDRMVDAGEFPSIVLREGARQRMLRIPRAFVPQPAT